MPISEWQPTTLPFRTFYFKKWYLWMLWICWHWFIPSYCNHDLFSFFHLKCCTWFLFLKLHMLKLWFHPIKKKNTRAIINKTNGYLKENEERKKRCTKHIRTRMMHIWRKKTHQRPAYIYIENFHSWVTHSIPIRTGWYICISTIFIQKEKKLFCQKQHKLERTSADVCSAQCTVYTEKIRKQEQTIPMELYVCKSRGLT